MSTMSLCEAAIAFEQRKNAIAPDGGEEARRIDGREIPLLAVGLDLNLREAHHVSSIVAEALLEAVDAGVCGQPLALKSAYLDGLMTGVMFADSRAGERLGELERELETIIGGPQA